LIVPVAALRAGSVNAFISCAHRAFQLLIDATTGQVSESKRFSVSKLWRARAT